jgi:catechol 2,3-dioxygenase-like lactoylglutathione lyase family enzyme
MLENSTAFSGVSSSDIAASKEFYGETLGLTVTDSMGGLDVELPGGAHLYVYPKPNHQPATFTFLNFAVTDLDATVDWLRARGVETKIYPDDEFPTDDRGIARGLGGGPDIAWFTDPSGNVIAVLADTRAPS